MVIKILTHKNPCIIEVFRETTAIIIEDDGEPLTMDVKTEPDGTKVYSYGDWGEAKDYV